MPRPFVVLALAAVLWGPVLGSVVGAADDNSVPETLRRIEEQTTKTGAQVSDPAKGLVALHGEVGALGATVEGVGDRLSSSLGVEIKHLLTLVGALKTEIAAVQSTLDRRAGAASRMWVSPYWEEGARSTPFHAILPAEVVVLNASDTPAHVGCLFFEAAGGLLLDRSRSMTVDRGATETCLSFFNLEPGTGWMIVHSDRPVLVYGWYRPGLTEQSDAMPTEEMRFFPVDCSNPEGFEFACQFASSDE